MLQEEVEVEEKPGVEGEAKQEDVRLKEEEEEVKGEPMRLALRTLGVSWNRPLSTGTVANNKLDKLIIFKGKTETFNISLKLLEFS